MTARSTAELVADPLAPEDQHVRRGFSGRPGSVPWRTW